MAFRSIDPNTIRAPLLSRDKTWSTVPKKSSAAVAALNDSHGKEKKSGQESNASTNNDTHSTFILNDFFKDVVWESASQTHLPQLQDTNVASCFSKNGVIGDRRPTTEQTTGGLEEYSKLFAPISSFDLFTDHSVPPEIATVWSDDERDATGRSSSVKTAESKKLVEWPTLTSSRNIKRSSVQALTKAHQNLSPGNKKLHAPPTMIRRGDGEVLLELLTTKKTTSRANLTANKPAGETSDLSLRHPSRPISKSESSQVTTLNYSDVARSKIPPGFHCVTKVPSSTNFKQGSSFSIYTDESSLLQRNNPQSYANVTRMTLEEYSRMLRGMSESKAPGSAERAEAMLRTISRKYDDGEHDIRPDGSCYNSVIHAYAQVGMPCKAEAVIRLMVQDFHSGNKLAEPNIRIFTNLLHAWRKSKDPEAPEKCEAILQEMQALSDSGRFPDCKPDTFAVTVLLHCWVESQRSEASHRAELIFRDMKQRYEKGNKDLRPDCISYSIVMNTFAQEAKYKEAEDLLWEMTDDFLSGNESAKPRTRNFNTIVAMYANNADAPERAEAVVHRFLELASTGELSGAQPDEYTYSLLLKSWVSSSRPDGVYNASACLAWMRSLYNKGDNAACPDVIKYTTIISAYARKGNCTMAVNLLNDMIDDSLNGNDRAKPDYKTFEHVLAAIVSKKCVSPTDASKVEQLLRTMWKLYESGKLPNARPHASTYKHVITGYKKNSNPHRADFILREMDRYSKSGKLPECDAPNKAMFQTVINAWYEAPNKDPQRLQKLRREMIMRFGTNGNSHNC